MDGIKQVFVKVIFVDMGGNMNIFNRKVGGKGVRCYIKFVLLKVEVNMFDYNIFKVQLLFF